MMTLPEFVTPDVSIVSTFNIKLGRQSEFRLDSR